LKGNIMTNVIAQLDAQPIKTLVADAVENYGVQQGNFNLASTSVIANGMQISVASQKVIADRISGVNQAIFALEQLEAEREHWEANEQAASHKRFYGILHSNYTFYLEMKTNPSAEVREAYKKGLETFLLTRNFATRLENTHDMNKVVKSVFGNIDRRRVSAYALALRAALVAGGVDSNGKKLHLPANKLIDWLISQGGVEEVRLGSKNNGKTAKEKAAEAKSAIESKSILTFKPDAKQALFDTEDVDKMCVLVATYRPNGDVDISAVVKDGAAVRAALAAYYSSNKDEIENQNTKGSSPPSISATDCALSNTGSKAE
jgi:hypothetical protein